MKPESAGVTVSSGSKDGELESSSRSENKLSLAVFSKSGSVKCGSEKLVWNTDRLTVSQVSIRKFLCISIYLVYLRTIDGIHSSLTVLGRVWEYR